MNTIDHDPKEPSHKAIKVIAIATLALTVLISVPVVFGVRWAVEQLPDYLLFLFVGLMFGCCGGFFIGRWDAIRQFRTPGKD